MERKDRLARRDSARDITKPTDSMHLNGGGMVRKRSAQRAKMACLAGVLLCGLSLLLCQEEARAADKFPSRPVEVIICFAPGGTLDFAVRLMGNELSKALGVPAILTNKGGGGGAVGAEFVARARPDGYTILAAPIGVFNILPFLVRDLHYKLSDFIPLCKYNNSASVLLVNKNSPYYNIKDIIADGKKNPGKLSAGVAGTGTSAHITLEMFKIEAGIDTVVMPFKSGGEVNTALLGGHISFAVNGLPPSLGLIKSGDLRPLASMGYKRFPEAPEVQTMAELGYPRAVLPVWTGYFLPKGTPKPVYDKLALAFKKAINSPSIIKSNVDTQQDVDYQDGPSFAKFIAEENKLLEAVVKKAKLMP